MHEQLKTALAGMRTALVDSFVGAIATGWLFAEGIGHFASIFTMPLTTWLQQRMLYQLNRASSPIFPDHPHFPVELAIPQLLSSLLLLLIAYGMLRWLYFPPVEKQEQDQMPEPEEGA